MFELLGFAAKYNNKMSANIIGRDREIKELNELYDSGKAKCHCFRKSSNFATQLVCFLSSDTILYGIKF